MASPYELAIHLSMTNAVSPVLAIISKDLLGLNMSAEKLEKTFDSIGLKMKLAVGGIAGIFAGVELGKGLLDIAKHGEALIHQQNMLRRAGVEQREIQALTDKAYADITREVPTATAADVLRTTNELRSVLGDIGKATAGAPLSLKIEALISNATGKDAEGEGFKLWRAMEMKGITTSNPALTQKFMAALVQDIIGSGGKLDAGTYQAMAKRGGAAWIHGTPEFLAGPASVLAADLGGDGAGTAMMTLRQLLTGATTMSKQQYEVFKEAGLINADKVSVDKGGRINAQPGAIKGSIEYGDDLYRWSQFIKPNLEHLAKGDPKVFDSLLAKIGRNRNAIKLLSMFTDEGFGDQIAKDVANWTQAMGVDQGYAAMVGAPWAKSTKGPGGLRSEAASDAAAVNAKTDAQNMADYTAVMGALQKQWESLMMAVGGPLAKAAIPQLQKLTDALNTIGNWANEHQDAVKAIGEAAAVLSAIMIALGGTAVVAAAVMIAGPVAAGVAAVAAAMAVLAAIHWPAIQDFVNPIHDAIEAMADKFRAAVLALPDEVAAAITSAIAAIGAKIAAAIASLGSLDLNKGNPPAATRQGNDSFRMHASYTPKDQPALMITAYNGPRDQVLHSHISLNLEGRILAQVVEKQIVKNNRAVDSAAGHDGRDSWAAPDVG